MPGAGIPIGEFAHKCGLSISALRFYDECGVISPVAVDDSSGYRLYSEDQLGTARLVRDLRRLEMPLATVRTFLALDPAERRKVLKEHLGQLDRRLTDIRRLGMTLQLDLLDKEPTLSATTLQGADLGAALDQVLPAAGEDPERPLLSCVLLELKDGSLRLVATDSYRLAVRDLSVGAGAGSEFRALIAGASLRRLRPGLDGVGGVRADIEEGKLRLAFGSAEHTIWLVPGEFPAYEQILASRQHAHLLQVDRTALADALSATVARGLVKLRLAPGHLTLETLAERFELDASYEGDGLEVVLNPRFAHYAVTAAVGPDVVIEATDAVSPVTFRSADDGTFVCLVMPIRS